MQLNVWFHFLYHLDAPTMHSHRLSKRVEENIECFYWEGCTHKGITWYRTNIKRQSSRSYILLDIVKIITLRYHKGKGSVNLRLIRTTMAKNVTLEEIVKIAYRTTNDGKRCHVWGRVGNEKMLVLKVSTDDYCFR
jgi:hypothetical protein